MFSIEEKKIGSFEIIKRTTKTTSAMETIHLRSGDSIPSVGLGTWQLENEQGHDAIVYALKNGYKMIDGAYAYSNQEVVGKAIKDSGIPRKDIFLIDKLANTWHTAAEECLEITLKNLNVDYLDLWLMHWPSPLNHNGNDKKTPKLEDGTIDFEKNWDYVKTWQCMIKIQKKFPEKVKRIGVANFGIKELDKIIEETGYAPEVNQVELHPANNQKKLRTYCEKKKIQLMAYSPLGSIGSPLLKNQKLVDLATSKNVTVAQLMLSWGVVNGWPVIPRSQNPTRILQNISLIDLTLEEIAIIDKIGDENKERFILAPWHEFADDE